MAQPAAGESYSGAAPMDAYAYLASASTAPGPPVMHLPAQPVDAHRSRADGSHIPAPRPPVNTPPDPGPGIHGHGGHIDGANPPEGPPFGFNRDGSSLTYSAPINSVGAAEHTAISPNLLYSGSPLGLKYPVTGFGAPRPTQGSPPA